MKSPKDQSVADKNAPRDGEGRKMDKFVPGQDADGSASLPHSEMSSKPNQGVGQTTSHWQNLASQNMVTVRGLARAGRHSRIPTDHQNAEVAQNSSTATPNLDHRQNNLAEGSFGKPEQPYNIDDPQSQDLQHSHKDILAAESSHKPCLNAGDAGGQGYPLCQESLLAQEFDDGQIGILEARGLHYAPPNMYDARGRASFASRKLYDAHGNAPSIQGFGRNAPLNVFDEPAQLYTNKGFSDRVTRCLPTSHNPSTTSAPSTSTNQTTLHPRHHSNKSSTRTTPGFSSPVPSAFNGNELSVNATPYVSITSPFTPASVRNNAIRTAASSPRFEPFTDPSSSIDPSPSSLAATSSSTTNTYTATMFPPSGIVISDADMECAMAYCFDRGNGQYTRLVPVDVLPFSLRDLPARVASHEGMIVLPIPRMVGPDGQSANVHLVPHVDGNNVTPPVSPTGTSQGGSTDLIQNHIDNIVAAAPNATSGSIALSRSAAAATGIGRREKVFCDKWIHDGTCAFTQQGCKFKHEMPMDKETQQSLGLFHGLPAWYRKQEAERVMHLDDRPVPLGGGAVGYYGVGPAGGRFGNNGGAFGVGVGAASRAQSWRRIEAAPPASGSTADDEGSSPLSGGSGSHGGYGRGRTGPRPANYRTTNNFGPIGPPSQSTGSLSGGHGDNRRRTNTGARFDLVSAGGTPVREAQRDDAAPRGGVRIANNPFSALDNYASASNTESDKGKGSDEALE
ncbi:hypothetical protein N0V82_002857 [Gnomoniopsis sp. IMI 355080]|nr:hypothetical protein N0V82_002857 [Gnomoniopsis sp. IMI 355080]